MASAKRTHDVLTAIRRNSCYNSGRTILLIVSVILALLSLVAGTSLFTLLDKEEPMAVLLAASVVLGGGSLAFLTNYLGNVFMDGADSLLQVAKFQERGQRTRGEALELARNAVEEEEEEEEMTDEETSRSKSVPEDESENDG